MRRSQLGFFEWIAPIASAVSAVGNIFGDKKANDQNIDQTSQNRQWQEEMSNTAHQREVKDLIAAGLNPILSANKGGATTPGGNVPIIHNVMERGLNSASDAARSVEEVRNKRANTDSTRQNIKIKQPAQSFADEIDEYIKPGMGAVKSGVEGAVKAVLDSIGAVQGAASKVGESVSGNVAAAASTVQNAAKEFGVRASEIIDNPYKYISSAVNSAVTGSKILDNKPHVMTSKSIGNSRNWSSDHAQNVRDIMSIKDPSLRSQARIQYDAWRRKYGK